jgi:hypothetical protein
MPESTPPTLANKLLFLEHLAQRIEAMEHGHNVMHAVAYRLYTRRLREALAGVPERLLARRLSHRSSAVAEAAANRFFATHGRLPGIGSHAARDRADDLLQRLRRR